MTPDVVVDVGNTRIKWGRCVSEGVVDVARLSPDDQGDWHGQAQRWSLSPSSHFLLAGVHPQRLQAHAEWLKAQGFSTGHLRIQQQLNLAILVEHPERVGMDRLLNAVAVNAVKEKEQSVLVVDAGSAVTVDWVDASGAFRGGAIYPGVRLMAEALHQYTAKLPLVDIQGPAPFPGTTTDEAIACGILNAVAGGIERLAALVQGPLLLTGGDASLLQGILSLPTHHWPEMTLEGIRLSANSASS